MDLERAGIALEYQHRIKEWLSGYAHGRVGKYFGGEWDAALQAGLRMRF